MGSRLGIRTEVFAPGEDHSWLKTAAGTLDCDSVTLDGDAFLATFTDGIVPSGVVLAKKAADGLYIPYVGTAEKQRLVVDGTGGTFTLTIDGFTLDAVNHNVSAADLQTAFEEHPGINPGDVVVTGGPGDAGGTTPYFVEFVDGQYAGEDNAPTITATDSLTGGAGTVTVTTPTAAPTDGSQVAKGHLFTTTDLGGTTSGTVGNVPVPLFWGPGGVIEANLPSNHGLDARAKADLKMIRYF